MFQVEKDNVLYRTSARIENLHIWRNDYMLDAENESELRMS